MSGPVNKMVSSADLKIQVAMGLSFQFFEIADQIQQFVDVDSSSARACMSVRWSRLST